MSSLTSIDVIKYSLDDFIGTVHQYIVDRDVQLTFIIRRMNTTIDVMEKSVDERLKAKLKSELSILCSLVSDTLLSKAYETLGVNRRYSMEAVCNKLSKMCSEAHDDKKTKEEADINIMNYIHSYNVLKCFHKAI